MDKFLQKYLKGKGAKKKKERRTPMKKKHIITYQGFLAKHDYILQGIRDNIGRLLVIITR
jgi:hypothetical protein